MDASNCDLEYFKGIVIDDFEKRVLKIINYYKIQKDISKCSDIALEDFETSITNIEDYLPKTSLDKVKDTEKPKCYICLKDIDNWKELFGKDSFPVIEIKVFRLGNTEYFSYNIHR